MSHDSALSINGLSGFFGPDGRIVEYVYPGSVEKHLGMGIKLSTSESQVQSVELGRIPLEHERSAHDVLDDAHWTWHATNMSEEGRIWVRHVLAAELEGASQIYEHEGKLVLIWHRVPTRETELALLAGGFQPSLATW